MPNNIKEGGVATHDRWRRRQATILIGQLPEDCEDALAILEYAREIALDYIAHQGEVRPATGRLSLVGS